SDTKLEGPILDIGCGGAPGAYLKPDLEWWLYDLDFSLVDRLEGLLKKGFRRVSPVDLHESPKTVLYMMSFQEIRPNVDYIQSFLEQGAQVIIIEPGTRFHFENLLKIRNELS